ncbi:MAG: DUF362 domain-containing protein [Nitrospirae bacterium]|nr:MAG: DUF362 domain-containing protein [Nitrospirota bacterium]
MPYKVVISHQSDYEYSSLKTKVHLLMDALTDGHFSAGQRVLIKPNLLAPARPEKAMLTHPLFLKAVVEYLVERDMRVTISDSPAMGGFKRVIKEGGFLEALKGLPVKLREFEETTKVDIGRPFGEVEIARDVFEVDHVINLPKLKTHSQMLLTLGVKNLFGTVVGVEKPKWHFRAGVDRDRFAELLYLIAKKIAPVLTLIDGVLAMEGDGPGKSGIPRKLGVLVGGSHPVGVDVVVCRMLNLKPERLLTNQAAFRDGFNEEDIELFGELPVIDDFKLPALGPIVFGPKKMQPFLRKHLVERPSVIPTKCKQCGECWSYCPVNAIKKAEVSVAFDYETCIRCYCCVEVCPHGALKVKEPLTGRVVRKLMNIKR